MRSNLETTERTDSITVIHVSSKPVHEILNMTADWHQLQIHSIFLPIRQNSWTHLHFLERFRVKLIFRSREMPEQSKFILYRAVKSLQKTSEASADRKREG